MREKDTSLGGNRSGTRQEWESYIDTLYKMGPERRGEVKPIALVMLKADDSALVREIHDQLISPWTLTPNVMAGLLNAVRELEVMALETERLRPATMMVEIKDDVLGPLIKRIEKLESRLTELKDAAADDHLDTPEVVSCDCPRSDEDVHTPSCPVLHQQLWGDDVPEKAAGPVDDLSWRDNPYSLPPATTEGVKCLACSVQNRPHHLAGRLISHETVFHADQATADECVRRQDAMTYRHLRKG